MRPDLTAGRGRLLAVVAFVIGWVLPAAGAAQAVPDSAGSLAQEARAAYREGTREGR